MQGPKKEEDDQGGKPGGEGLQSALDDKNEKVQICNQQNFNGNQNEFFTRKVQNPFAKDLEGAPVQVATFPRNYLMANT